MAGISSPEVKAYGSSFGVKNGSNLSGYEPAGHINPDKLNITTLQDDVEFNLFEETIKDFILMRLGHPVIRVELTGNQLKSCVDEAITKLDYHAPLWTRQYAAFQTVAGVNVYDIPRFIMNNLEYVVYKKTLLSIASQSGTLEFDFFIKYFQDNHLFGDFSVGEFFLLQQHLEQLRKVLSQEGTWEIINNRYLQIHPTPVNSNQVVILEYRALDTNTIHPAYRNWIQKYALAISKGVLGTIRGKFKTMPSPGGGAVLDGPELIEASMREMEKLEEQLIDEIEGPIIFTTF